MQSLSLIPLWYAAFLLSVTGHEAAHAWVAYLGGDSTAYHGGQVTLNPLPHVQREPFGTVVVPLLTYFGAGWMMGWASAPYDPFWAARHPRRAAVMALAGPLANLTLALAAFAALKIGLAAGWWAPLMECCAADQFVTATSAQAGGLEALGRFCSILLTLNLLLFLFNLVPLPPLDGGAIVGGFVAPLREPLERLASQPIGSMGGILVAFVVFRYVPLIGIIRDWILFPGMYGPV